MYKTRFTKWDFGKNNKRHEVLAMIRKRARRAAVGKASRFHVRGQPVDMTDVERYLHRAGLSVQDAIDLPAATPPTLRCSTPDSIIYSPKPPGSTRSLRVYSIVFEIIFLAHLIKGHGSRPVMWRVYKTRGAFYVRVNSFTLWVLPEITSTVVNLEKLEST